MQISRRSFLRLSAAGGAFAAVGGCRSFFVGAESDYDPNLTVFFSDIHVRGGESYQLDRFKPFVAEVLKMNPLPKNVVIFGDLAYLYGAKADYETTAPYLKMLSDAGITVTIGMGNHDRRSNFFAVHPDYAKRVKVPGRVISVADAGYADILMMDSLAGSDDRGANDMGPVAGTLDKAQQEWLLAELPKWRRPVFVCAHHPLNELSAGGKPLKDLIIRSPAVAGYIHGHNHRWYTGWAPHKWGSRGVLRSLCLPSTGHWGDIGYTMFRTAPGHAVATLDEREFYFPKPLAAGEARPEVWDAILEENKGASCKFILPKV